MGQDEKSIGCVVGGGDQWINGSVGSMDQWDQWISEINGSMGSMDQWDQWDQWGEQRIILPLCSGEDEK